MGLLSIVPKLFGYAKRAVKAAPEFILGTGSETVGAAMRAKKGSIFTKAKAGALALEKDIAKKSLQGGFFKRTVKNLITTPKSLIHGTKVGARAAKIAGKSSFLGGLKGLGKGIAKKMPFIGALLTIGFELPNIFKAGNKEGTGEALKETGKAVGRLAGGAAGAAIGSAICPGIGTLIGWVAGEWLTGKLIGPSYQEKLDKLAELGIDEKQVNELKKQGYTVDQLYDEAKNVDQKSLNAQTVEYTKDDIDKLKSYGLTDEEIAQIQANGYTVAEVEQLLKQEAANAQTQNTQNTQDNKTAQAAQTEQAADNTTQTNTQQAAETNYQPKTDPMYYNPFTAFNTFNPYMGGGLYNNANLLGNPYTNDIMYQQAFNGINAFDWQNPTNQYFRYVG